VHDPKAPKVRSREMVSGVGEQANRVEGNCRLPEPTLQFSLRLIKTGGYTECNYLNWSGPFCLKHAEKRVVARAAQVVALRPDPLCWCNSLIRPSKGMNAAEVYEIASSHLQSGIDDTSAGLWIDAIS